MKLHEIVSYGYLSLVFLEFSLSIFPLKCVRSLEVRLRNGVSNFVCILKNYYFSLFLTEVIWHQLIGGNFFTFLLITSHI